MSGARVITLTTDFGEASPYVAAMKGVILAANPAARVVDLSHQIPAQDVRHAAFFLAAALPYFPAGVIHVVVVDPGVGTERSILCAEAGGCRVLAPDNGCWTLLPGAASAMVRRVSEARFWRPQVSPTFHGRDVFAPVAAHLSRGLDPGALGPTVKEWDRLTLPEPRRRKNAIAGEVVFVDAFGNLITNVPAAAVAVPPATLSVAGRKRAFRWVRTYGEAPRGTLVALVSSTEALELAVVQGNAARRLKAKTGTPVVIGWDARRDEVDP